VVLPSHNEATHLTGVIRSIPQWVRHVIVVDDGSTDETPHVLARITDPRLVVIRHEHNLGFGAAVATGYRQALGLEADAVVKMDADGQMSADDLETIVAPLAWDLADYVKGNRFHSAQEVRAMPADRRIGNLVASLIAKPATGYWHLFDPHSGYTAIAADTLRRIDLDTMARDYEFQIQQLLVLRPLDARVVDVPVRALYGDEVSGMHFGDAIRLPLDLARGWIRRARRGREGPAPAHGIEGLLERASARASGYGRPGWWTSPANIGVGLLSLGLALVLLALGASLSLADATLARSRTPGSRENRVVAKRIGELR
jgi:glycosyltransferase involved in cell wall biosynthesis